MASVNAGAPQSAWDHFDQELCPQNSGPGLPGAVGGWAFRANTTVLMLSEAKGMLAFLDALAAGEPEAQGKIGSEGMAELSSAETEVITAADKRSETARFASAATTPQNKTPETSLLESAQPTAGGVPQSIPIISAIFRVPTAISALLFFETRAAVVPGRLMILDGTDHLSIGFLESLSLLLRQYRVFHCGKNLIELGLKALKLCTKHLDLRFICAASPLTSRTLR